jgi:hypothetical protein
MGRNGSNETPAKETGVGWGRETSGKSIKNAGLVEWLKW